MKTNTELMVSLSLRNFERVRQKYWNKQSSRKDAQLRHSTKWEIKRSPWWEGLMRSIRVVTDRLCTMFCVQFQCTLSDSGLFVSCHISKCKYCLQDCGRFLRSLDTVLYAVIQTLIYTLSSLNDLQKWHLLSKVEIYPSSFIDSIGERKKRARK